jgi:hypothetical protein
LDTKQFKKGIAKKRRKVIDIWQNFQKFIYYPNQWVPSINTKGVFLFGNARGQVHYKNKGNT